jgi:hypothetical protein
MKPDFKQMTKDALKAYVLLNREDEDAVRELFSRRNPNGQRFPAPRTQEEITAQTEILRQKLQGQ